MKTFLFVFFVCCILGISSAESIYQNEDDFLVDTFPKDFMWGLGTCSYQIEGAWNLEGKGPNIWDEFTHRSPSPIADNTTGDDACLSYYKYKDDVQLLKDMGATFYRFSISWSRVLPTGKYEKEEDVNEAGITYYSNLIDELLENGIKPMITIYCWDLPLALEVEYGGWLNEAIIPHYVAYADLLFKRLGDRVPYWITFNEPWTFCHLGYGLGDFAPGIKNPAEGSYICGHTTIKAHARAYHLYYEKYAAAQNGLVGITLSADHNVPKNASDPLDVDAAERSMQFAFGWFANPVIFGNYPEIMIERMEQKRIAEGRNTSRLPVFTDEEIQENNGTCDFIGLNAYTTVYIENIVRDPENLPEPSWDSDQDTSSSFDPTWPGSASEWLKVVPWGLRGLVKWLQNTYGDQQIIITENGVSDLPEVKINDADRVYYHTYYLNNLLKAVKVDGISVIGYTAWSLLDNFEWLGGRTEKFGVHHVDFECDARTRTPKESAKLLKQIFMNNGFLQPPPTEGLISTDANTRQIEVCADANTTPSIAFLSATLNYVIVILSVTVYLLTILT